MKILRPNRWIIDIWEEDGVWHEKYIELVHDTPENRLVIKPTIDVLNLTLKVTGFSSLKVEGIEMDEMIGFVITSTSKTLEPIANQLMSEFILLSGLGDISLRDIFMLGIETIAVRELEKTKIVDSTKNDLKGDI